MILKRMEEGFNNLVLFFKVDFLDASGEFRHVYPSLVGFTRKRAEGGPLTSTFHTKDPLYAKRYALTGEYGIRMSLVVSIGRGGGSSHSVFLAESSYLSPDEVKELMAKAKKPEDKVARFPCFMEFVREEDAYGAAIKVELARIDRNTCISKIWFEVEPGLEEALAAQLAILRAQLR